MKLILFGILLILFSMFMNSISSGMDGVWAIPAIAGLFVGIFGLRNSSGKDS